MSVDYNAAVKTNQHYRNILDWQPAELGIVESMTDGELVTHIAALQQQLRLPVDGVLGPKTYSGVLLEQRVARIKDADAAPTQIQRLQIAGEVWVLNGKIAWMMDIRDGKKGTFPEASRQFIDALMRTTAGVNWSWLAPYVGDGGFEWCGAFEAYCQASGVPIKQAIRTTYSASTIRLEHFFKYLPWETTANPKPSFGPFRQYIELDENSKPGDAVYPDGSLPRPGDTCMVGGVHTGPGRHITTVTGFNPNTGVVSTIEGNATTLGPDGSTRQGVGRATRRIGLLPGTNPNTYHVRRFGRMAPTDLVA